MKLCEPCYRKAKNVEFRSLLQELSLLEFLSSQELSIGGSRVRGSQQVGESPSSQ